MARTLSIGMAGGDVRSLQDALNFHLRTVEPLHVDGVFGKKTEARVRLFQQVNGLKVDGIAGPQTHSALYEVTEIDLQIGMMPRLQLTLPQLGKKPQAFDPSQWPAPTLTLPGLDTSWITNLLPGPRLLLPESSRLSLPWNNEPYTVFNWKLVVPTRKDPTDPAVRSYTTLVEWVNQMPVDSKFKLFLISKIPNPVKKISPPGVGFKWGVEPVWSPGKPTQFGLKANAQFTVQATQGAGGLPQIFFSAWGDLKATVDLDKKQGETLPRTNAEGTFMFGLKGVF